MKYILSFMLLCAPLSAAKDLIKRQSGTSTSSVFSVPTPSAAPTVNGSDHDLSQHFCRLWRHQSVYADGKIYVDGGNTYIPDNGTTFNTQPLGDFEQGMNDVILVIDLSSNFTNQDTFPYSVLDKPPDVPNALIEGTLWYSQITRKIYQLGGWFSTNNQADPGYIAKVPESAIWELSIDSYSWEKSSFTVVNTGSKIDRPGAANACDAPSLNKSFIFEGYVQKRSDADYANYTVNSEFKYLEGMLQLDTNPSNTPPVLSNVSVPSYIGPRMNGAMIYVPVGSQGVLVLIGGQTTDNPTPYGIGIQNANAGNTNINNSFVDIFDVETGYWFRQETFGVPDIPPGRSDICTILVTAEDKSSFNIFMIAGVETYNSVIAYEDMWVLTLPTFQWVKVHTRPGGIYGHTCHAVGENLLVIGGMQTTDTGGNVRNCSTHMPAEIFSLAQMEYTGVFDFAGASRPAPVPTDVVKLIGGTSSGGAVVTKPSVWSDLYLQYIFTPNLPRPSYTPTYTLANVTSTSSPPASSPKHKSHIAPIVGGVVGGLIFLALLTILGLYLFRRHRKNTPPDQPGNSAELPTYQESKDRTAVEVSGFSEYRPREPAEMAGEDMDYFPVDEGRATPRINGSPQMGNTGRFSEAGSDGVGGQRSPGLRSESRVSEISDPSGYAGEGGRNSRLSGGTGTISPPPSTVETIAGSRSGAVRRKPVGI
ncbi:hypothetical protein N431DRAFT_489847 [Stipitochalara longipes BDJ]|nr:hypothetical protein N431DRAFT_489847 [Stipitochalara longipes BDJ]